MSVLSAARRAKHAGHLLRVDARNVRGARRFRRDHRQTLASVAAQLDLPPLPRHRGAVWAIAMVHDEADVLGACLRTLAAQGVDEMLVVDNLSTDGTRDALADLARDLPLHVGADRCPAYEQAATMTLLADAVTRAGAAWVVPVDADELWMGADGTLAESLRAARSPVVVADLVNAFPDPHAPERWRLDPTPHFDPKVAFRPFPGAALRMGNHEVLRPGRRTPGLGIVHRPWRSFEQFRAKVRHGAAALDRTRLDADAGTHWRRLGALDDDALRGAWRDLLDGTGDEHIAWRPFAPTVPVDLDALTWDDVRRARAGGA